MMQTVKYIIHLIQNNLIDKENKMENQHRQIKGYRELDQAEIDLMNKIKAMGPQLAEVVSLLENLESTDKRWVAIGKTDLQKGLMALTRAVAKPDFF